LAVPPDVLSREEPWRVDGLRGRRLGVPGQASDWPEGMLDRVAAELEGAGATLVRGLALPRPPELPGWAVLHYEFRPALDAYLGALAPHVPVHSVADVVRFNRREPWRSLRYGQTQFLNALGAAGGLSASAYWEARRRDLQLTRGTVSALLDRERLDALIFPGARGAALGAKAGWPSLTVPGGWSAGGEPWGLTFMGPAFSEPVLFAMAFAYEAATGHGRRTPPA
jgi:amidase